MRYFHGISWLNNGHGERDDAWVVRQFRQKYGICHVHDGAFEIRMDGGAIHRIQAPAAMLYYPGPKFEYGVRHAGRHWNNRFINFTGPRMKALIEKGLFPTDRAVPVFPVNQPELFCAAHDELRAYVNSARRNEDIAVHKLEGLLLLLHQQGAAMQNLDAHARKIARLRDDIQRNPAASWDFHEEARQMGLSYSHFRSSFRSFAGKPPQQTLIQLRLAHAAQLLLRTDRKVADIAAHVGIPDPHYFMRSFKKCYRMSPGRYRCELA